MKDTIIKGEGTSRRLRAPATMPETYSEWRQQAIDGDATFDIVLDEDGVDVLGTPLNKSTLLSDSTKSTIGLTQDDPTVNDAFAAIAEKVNDPVDGISGRLKVTLEPTTGLYQEKIPTTGYDGTGTNTNTKRFVCGNNKYLIVDMPYESPSYTSNKGWISTDLTAKTWQSVTIPGSYLRDAAYGDGKFVVLSGVNNTSTQAGSVAYSTNGTSWTSVNLPQKGGWSAINYCGGLFIANGSRIPYSNSSQNTNIIAVSVNALAWSSVTLPVSQYYNLRAVYGNGKYVLFPSGSDSGRVNYYVYSSDGYTWQSSSISSWGVGDIQGCQFINGRFLVYTSQRLYSSTDGLNWTQIQSGMIFYAQRGKMFEEGNGRIVYAYQTNLYYTDDDFATWKHFTFDDSAEKGWNLFYIDSSNIIWDGERFVALTRLDTTTTNIIPFWFTLDALRTYLQQNNEDVTSMVQRALDLELIPATVQNLASNADFMMSLAAEQDARIAALELGIN